MAAVDQLARDAELARLRSDVASYQKRYKAALAQVRAAQGDTDARDLVAALEISTVSENTGMVPPNYLRDIIGLDVRASYFALAEFRIKSMLVQDWEFINIPKISFFREIVAR